MQKPVSRADYNYLFLPGYYPAFFPVEPGLSSCLMNFITRKASDYILSVTTTIIKKTRERNNFCAPLPYEKKNNYLFIN